MRLALILILLAAPACSRHETLLDGRTMYSTTERGKFTVTIPEGWKVDGPAVPFDRLVATARDQLKDYTSDPSGWELDGITRWHRHPPVFYTVAFTRGADYREIIIVPISPDGRVLASLSGSPQK